MTGQVDVAWVVHEPFFEPLIHLIGKLESQGVRQYIGRFEDYYTQSPAAFEQHVLPVFRSVYEQRPLLIVWCCHVGNPCVVPLYQQSPALLNLIIEHDLFSLEPEGCVATDRPHELLVFTRQHWAYRHDAVAPNRWFTPVRWYKLDAPPREDMQAFLQTSEGRNWDRWQYGMLVESLFYTDAAFPFAHLFRKVFQKPWKQAVPREGVVQAPVDLSGPLGIVSAQFLTGFWFSRKSSALVEALFHGCIPVMYPHPEVPEEECGRFYLEEIPHPTIPVLSRVVIDKGNPANGKIIPATMVTTSGDFPEKIRLLREDEQMREQALREMARQWLFTPYGTDAADWPPTVDQIILERLAALKGTE